MVGRGDEMVIDGQLPSSMDLLGAPDSTIGDAKSQLAFPQTMQIELVRETVKEMQRLVRQGKSIQLQFGKNPTLQYGPSTKTLHISPTKFRTEVYSNAQSSTSLNFGALVSHLIAVEDLVDQADQSMAGSDDALARLKSSLAGHKRDRENNSATLFIDKVPTKNDLGRGARGPRSALFARAGLGERAKSATKPSSALSSTSADKNRPSTSSQVGAALSNPSFSNAQSVAARRPLIHLLAMRPISTDLIIKKTKIPEMDCQALLQKVAGKSSTDDEWTLADRYYKDLDVWSFPYRKTEDREAAIENAVKAYDRMRVSREDKLWQLLLPKEERGKGKVLSKIKFRPGVGNTKQTPPSIVSTAENVATTHAPRDSTSPAAGRPDAGGKSLPSDHRSMLASIDGGQPMVRSTSNESARGHTRKTSDMEKRLFSKTKKPGTPLSRPTSGTAQSKKTAEPKLSKKTSVEAIEKAEKAEKPTKTDKKSDVKVEKTDVKSDKPNVKSEKIDVKVEMAEKAEKPLKREMPSSKERPAKAAKTEKTELHSNPVKVEAAAARKAVKAEAPDKKAVAQARPLARKVPVTSSSSRSSIPTASPSSGSEGLHKQVTGKKRKAEDGLESSQSRIKTLKLEYNKASSEYLHLRAEVDQLKDVPQARLDEVWEKYNKYTSLAKRVQALEEGLASPIQGLHYNLSPRTQSYLENKLEKMSQEYRQRRNEADKKNYSEDEKEELHNMYDEIQGLKKICAMLS